MRNHLLHQGALSYENSEVHQEQNKVNEFTLYFNLNECDGGSSSVHYRWGTDEIEHRAFKVNALNLIMKLRLCAMGYYAENREKFDFMNITILEKGVK